MTAMVVTRLRLREPGLLDEFFAEPHLDVTSRLDEWCDEATFVDWEQDDPALPDWQTCYEHVIADGQVAELSNASPANVTRDFPPPVV